MLGETPVVGVYAISDLGRLDGALYQARVLELAEMLRHCGFGYGQHLMDLSEKTFVFLSQEIEYGYPGGVAHGFREACQSLLLGSYVYFRHIRLSSVIYAFYFSQPVP